MIVRGPLFLLAKPEKLVTKCILSRNKLQLQDTPRY